MKKSPYKIRYSDIILSVFIVIAALSVYLIMHIYNKHSVGKMAVVSVSGEEYGSYSINKNQTVKIETEYGLNYLEIKDGEAKIIDADCPDKYCIHQSAISKKGEIIVCLPHKMTVEISDYQSDDSSEQDIDAVVK